MASLYVIQGADQGKRFTLRERPMALGREGSNPIRINDNEVSRKHAEIRPVDQSKSYRIVDLGSANGTFLNGEQIDQAPLKSGDQLRLGQTVMVYAEEAVEEERDLTARVDMLSKAASQDRSAILKSIPIGEGSKVLQAPGSVGEWLKVRLANLSVMYQATQAVSAIIDTDALLQQILQLVFDSINADRCALLLRDSKGELTPKAARWKGEVEPDERMAISRTIVDHVLEHGQGVITTDATADKRFGPAQSIFDYGIREAICVPVQGRHETMGVLYADVRASTEVKPAKTWKEGLQTRFSQDHLMLMAAIGHQAGLAIENTNFYQAKLQAERLAAVGQTIATLSHHIKNILQGIRGGSYLIDLGLKEKDEAIVRRGWTIVEKNQGKIYNLVMDMLSFSKEREPSFENAQLNQTVADVIELMSSRASDLGVELNWAPAGDLPSFLFDPEGVHQAVLNIVTNAVDASEEAEGGGKVRVSTCWDSAANVAKVVVEDNGIGIPPEEYHTIFQVFASTKGARGTGLGLPVSQKIIQEHGGVIEVVSHVGKGSLFSIEIPIRCVPAQSTGPDPLATLS